jgi:hypothetical protein
MTARRIRALTLPPLLLTLLLALGCSQSRPIRFATFNASLNRDKPGKLIADLLTLTDAQAQNVAEIIQRVNPDVLLINEFDHDQAGRALFVFQKSYLEVAHNGAQPVHFPYHYLAPVNTGIASGFDLDNDGKVYTDPGTRGYGGDALGFGLFPGQYGMVLLSKFPIDERGVRTFQRFKWRDMPGAMLPVDAKGRPWYSPEELKVLPLSSKSHWDVPVKIGKQTIHVLVSHPTPPSFDGPEDRNGKRNHDEIRLWADYVRGSDYEPARAGYIRDDTGTAGGLERNSITSIRTSRGQRFVIMGDANADPNDGGSVPGAIQQLLDNPMIDSSFVPSSEGGAEAARTEGGANASHKTDPHSDTADFPDAGDTGPGNLRCDYVLPSRGMKIVGGGVFWPVASNDLSRLVKMDPTAASSDHRLVYLDLRP